MYHPKMGVWTIRDPVQEGLNLYENVRSNPTGLLDPSGLAATLPPGFEKASKEVSWAATADVTSGWTRQTDARETAFGAFRAVGVAGRRADGQMGASIFLDFDPNEDTKNCCEEINVIQQMHMMLGNTASFGGDWSSPPDGKTKIAGTEGQAATWATKDGRYIERSHTVNTPFMAGTVNEGGGVTGRPGVGGQSLYWTDAPHTSPDIARGGSGSKIEVVACVICKKGKKTSAWNGKFLGAYRYGVTYTPKPTGPGASGQRPTATYTQMPLTFYENMPPGVMESVGAWNKYVEQTGNGWPKIETAG